MTEQNESTEKVDQNQQENEETKTLTQSELDSLMDKHTAKVLEKQKADFEKQLAEAIQQGKTEGEKLATMSAKEKAEEEAKQRLADLEAREKELNQRELTINVSSLLKERELPTDLAESLVKLGNADEISTVVDSLQQVMQQGINDGVKEHFRQDRPKNGATKISGDIGKVEFNAMTAAERVAFSKSNPEQFKQITGE
ncbi:scaffold protein [Leuconostoc phage LLC-1]|nr:scaffold protein [Leuconostoc phage LLC-1]